MRGLTLGDPALLGAAAGFSPLSLSPALWLDASDAATITSSGGKVSQWNDKSGNGRNVTQATSSAQPSTGTATQNGLNVLSFDGGDLLAAATAATWKFMHDGTIYFVSMVAKAGNVADPNALYLLLSTAALASTTVGVHIGYEDRTAVPVNNAVRTLMYRGTSNILTIDSYPANTWTANTTTIVSALFDPSNATAANRVSIRTNGSGESKTNTLTNSPSASNPTYALTVGASGAGQSPLIGTIAEIVIVSGANATDANRQLVRNYLNTKWAVY